jgi:hypothetical protein
LYSVFKEVVVDYSPSLLSPTGLFLSGPSLRNFITILYTLRTVATLQGAPRGNEQTL